MLSWNHQKAWSCFSEIQKPSHSVGVRGASCYQQLFYFCSSIFKCTHTRNILMREKRAHFAKKELGKDTMTRNYSFITLLICLQQWLWKDLWRMASLSSLSDKPETVLAGRSTWTTTPRGCRYLFTKCPQRLYCYSQDCHMQMWACVDGASWSCAVHKLCNFIGLSYLY